MTPEDKKTFWQEHVGSWRKCGLSQKAYCQQHKLSFASFCYWRTRLNKKSTGKKLIPVTLPKTSGAVSIFLPSGVRMEVPVHALADVMPIIAGQMGV